MCLTTLSVAIFLLAPGIYVHLLPNEAKTRIKKLTNILSNAQAHQVIEDISEKRIDVLQEMDKHAPKTKISALQMPTKDNSDDKEKSANIPSDSNSDRLNSDESLIDLDEDQQDDFVIL